MQVRLDEGEVLDVDVKHVVGTALDVVIWDLPGVGTPGAYGFDSSQDMQVLWFFGACKAELSPGTKGPWEVLCKAFCWSTGNFNLVAHRSMSFSHVGTLGHTVSDCTVLDMVEPPDVRKSGGL